MLLTLLSRIAEIINPPQPEPDVQLGGPPSTYSNRTRQEEYEEYLKAKIQRNNYLTMMASL